ncbi:MAG: hypothetical protein ACI88Z_000640 [Sphingobacteriales bacterium]|jgi:hypothetical protein
MAKKNFMGMMKDKTSTLKPSLLTAEEEIKGSIIILDELKELIPPLLSDETQQLEKNIIEFGVKDPLTVWETTEDVITPTGSTRPVFVLIDGHNRFKIITRHTLDYRINIMSFPSLNSVKEYMIDYQLGRRNLTPEQSSFLRGKRYLQEKQERGGYKADKANVDVSEELAKTYGVSNRTIKRDGEYAAGLEKIATPLRTEILSGKQKVPKSVIKDIGKNIKLTEVNSLDELPKESGIANKISGNTKEELEQIIKKLAIGKLTKLNLIKLQSAVSQLIRK